MIDLTPFRVSLVLAILTTSILLCTCFPLAFIFARSRSRVSPWIESALTLPLVMPPTVLGFYILIALSPASPAGRWFEAVTGHRLVFTFSGLVIASCIAGLPFMLNALKNGIQTIPRNLIEASKTLGARRMKTIFRVIIPCMKHSLLTGIILTFTHTLGEFGVVLMIGGSIPGVTKVASIAIYEQVESQNFAVAHLYALILVLFSYICVFALNHLGRIELRTGSKVSQ